MENSWLKEKVRTELEAEYKIKFEEVSTLYNKKLIENLEAVSKAVQEHKSAYDEERSRYEKECAKYAEMETKLYTEFNKSLEEYKVQIRSEMISAIDRYLKSPEYKAEMTSEQIVDVALIDLCKK